MRISDWSSDVCSSDLILRPLARQGADKLAPIGEVVAPVMELHPVTVSRQADISRMAVHAGVGEDVRPIHRHALRFIDGRRIAILDLGIVFKVERYRSTFVPADPNLPVGYPHPLSQRPRLSPTPH